MGRSGSRREEKAERGGEEVVAQGRLKEERERRTHTKRKAVWKWGFVEGEDQRQAWGQTRLAWDHPGWIPQPYEPQRQAI